MENEGILISGGEFNIVMNHRLDTTSKINDKRNLEKFVKLSLKEMRLIDIWRRINPTRNDYTL